VATALLSGLHAERASLQQAQDRLAPDQARTRDELDVAITAGLATITAAKMPHWFAYYGFSIPAISYEKGYGIHSALPNTSTQDILPKTGWAEEYLIGKSCIYRCVQAGKRKVAIK